MNVADDHQRSGLVEAQIADARRGSRSALGRLLESCRQYLLLIASQESGPEIRAKVGASDLVQETFLEAQRDFAGFNGRNETELLAWLRRILLNNLANVARHYRGTEKRQLDREVPLDAEWSDGARQDLAAQIDSPSAEARAREQVERLQTALERLPAQYRQIIEWRSYDRARFAEIGLRLGSTEEAARKVWLRAVEQLRQIMEPEHDSRGPGAG